MASFRIITFGCKVNQYESAYLRESLIREGWTEPSGEERPDVVIVNTCMVTNEAQSQSRQAMNRAARENPGARVVAGGCYAELLPDEVSRINGVDLVAGNRLKGRLPAILSRGAVPGDSHAWGFSRGVPLEHLPVHEFGSRTRGFLKVQDGCESYCSYCIVPYARGPLRSIEPLVAIQALRSLSARGYEEVVLTGIHLGKYGVDLSPPSGLKGLLRMITAEGLPMRIRLSSIEPNELDDELIELISGEEQLCKHLHLPLQSGDDRVLERMNRKYTSWEFAALVERVHEAIPFAAIGVDVMVGFPGEDEDAFGNTRSLIRDLPVSYLHVFPFSPRRGTRAAEFPDQVSPGLIKKRAAELRTLGREKRSAFYRSCVGREFEVVVETISGTKPVMARGFSDNYIPVTFPCEGVQENSLARIRVEGVNESGVTGRAV